MRAYLLLAFVIAGTGCGQRLTPDKVRELLDHPKGAVSKDTMARITGDLFQADRATGVEGIANLLKGNQAQPGGANAIPGVSAGVLEDAGDVFCVGGLVAQITSFDNCKSGTDCHADLTLDSCVLRIGDPGSDEDARGKIEFKIDATTSDTEDKADLALLFNGWQSSHDDGSIDAIDGQIALDTVIKHGGDNEHAELVFASDVDTKVVKKQHDFFSDGVVDKDKVVAGLRFIADSTDTSGHGSLEVLAFASDNGDDDSVKIKLEADGHDVHAETATASASLEVVGSNGTFSCSWAAAAADGTPEGQKVSSNGECTDEDGKKFTWSGDAVSGT